MNEFISKLIGGMARAVSIYIGGTVMQKIGVSGSEADLVAQGAAIVTTGTLWTLIHWIEEKLRNRKK